MSTFFNSVSSVLVILLLTGAGWFCAWRGYLTESGKNMISKLLLRLCIPCMILSNFQTSFTRESLQDAGRGILTSFVILFILMLLSMLTIWVMRIPRRQAGVFLVLAALSNAMFVGYPMCLELFGEVCVNHVMVFYLADMICVQLFGCCAIRFSGGSDKLISAKMLKKLATTPAIVAISVAFVFLLLDVRLPDFVLSAAKYLSNCVTPLALLVTGYIIYSIGIKRLRFDKTLTVVMLFRFVLSPAVALLICRVFAVEGLLRSVIVVECAMPAPSQTVVFASEFGADDALAARGCSVSTLLSFIEIPLIMLLLKVI